MVTNAVPQSISGEALLKKIIPSPEPVAIFSILLLLLLSLVYAHMIWLVERETNALISSAYGPGVFDAWWMAMAVAVSLVIVKSFHTRTRTHAHKYMRQHKKSTDMHAHTLAYKKLHISTHARKNVCAKERTNVSARTMKSIARHEYGS